LNLELFGKKDRYDFLSISYPPVRSRPIGRWYKWRITLWGNSFCLFQDHITPWYKFWQ